MGKIYEVTIKYRGLGENIKTYPGHTFNALSYDDGMPGVFSYWEMDGETQRMIPWDIIFWLKLKGIEGEIISQ